MEVTDPAAAAADKIANLSTIKRVCLRNFCFDVEPYGINDFFKGKVIKKEVSYIFGTLFADQTVGTRCSNVKIHILQGYYICPLAEWIILICLGCVCKDQCGSVPFG